MEGKREVPMAAQKAGEVPQVVVDAGMPPKELEDELATS
jgi:hypothetical protein